jgi:membrane-associated phospholipid phosphatase
MIDWLHALDTKVLEHLYAVRTMPGIDFFILISEFGRPYTIVALTASLALCLYLKRMYGYILGLLFAVAGTGLSVLIVKELTVIARPELPYPAYFEIGYAFPSFHAAGALALYGFCIFLVVRFVRSAPVRAGAATGLGVLVLLVSYSRLYLGVHYLTDVLGGMVVGAIFLIIGILLARRKV